MVSSGPAEMVFTRIPRGSELAGEVPDDGLERRLWPDPSSRRRGHATRASKVSVTIDPPLSGISGANAAASVCSE